MNRQMPYGVSNLVAGCRFNIAEEPRSLPNVHNFLGFEPIKPAQIASAATASSASTILPNGRAVPFSAGLVFVICYSNSAVHGSRRTKNFV